MSKTNSYFVRGCFKDDKIGDPIIYARSEYDFTIEAEDMKKAHDIALEYMPSGSFVYEISLGKSGGLHNDSPRPFY